MRHRSTRVARRPRQLSDARATRQGEDVDRAGGLLHDPGDVAEVDQARRVDDLRPGVAEGDESGDRLVEVGAAVEEALGAGGEHEAGRCCRISSGGDACDGDVEGVDGLLRRVVVLERAAGDTGVGKEPNRLGNAGRVVGEAALGVDADRDVDRAGERCGVSEELVAGDVLVEPSEARRVP